MMTIKERTLLYVKNITSTTSMRGPIIAIALLGIGIGGFFLYRWNTIRRQRLAQLAFTESMDVYQQAWGASVTPEAQKEAAGLWEEVELAFKSAYEQNDRTTYAPFFLAFQAQALAQQGKIKEAFDLFEQATIQLTSQSHFYYLLKIAQALILFEDKDSQQKAVELLQTLINDEKNPLNVMALYYLGEYYMNQQQDELARAAFAQAVAQRDVSTKFVSPWIQLSQARLQQLG